MSKPKVRKHHCDHCSDPARTDRDMKLPKAFHEPLPDECTPDVIEEMEMARYFGMDNVTMEEDDA